MTDIRKIFENVFGCEENKMKTIDGKSIEELRIGQEVWFNHGKMIAAIITRLDSCGRIFVKRLSDEIILDVSVKIISTTKPKVKVKKKFYCFGNCVDDVWWSTEENNAERHYSVRRIPKKDFEAEVEE